MAADWIGSLLDFAGEALTGFAFWNSTAKPRRGSTCEVKRGMAPGEDGAVDFGGELLAARNDGLRQLREGEYCVVTGRSGNRLLVAPRA